jgi:hypothetical protein
MNGNTPPFKVTKTVRFAVDRSPPIAPSGFDASLDQGSAQAAVTWASSWDPALSDGTAGSGLDHYQVSYQRGAGSWSAWQTTTAPYIVLGSAFAGESIGIRVQAVDAVGNASAISTASMLIADRDADCEICEPADNCAGPPAEDLPDDATADNSDRYCSSAAECSTHGGGQSGAVSTTASALPCEGWFAALHRVAHVFFWREQSGRLYWDFRLTSIAWAELGPVVGVAMTWAQVNNGPINPPYRLHVRPNTYNFHASLLSYQKFGGGGGTIHNHDIVQFWWLVTSESADYDRVGGRYIRCEVQAP